MSFYAPGWDYNRLLTATSADWMTLTDEQHTTMMTGLKEAGLFDGLMAELEKRYKAEQDAIEAAKPEEQRLAERELRAPYIDTLKLVFKFDTAWSEWGFVVFRAGLYGPQHKARWEEFRARWDCIFQQEFEAYKGYHPKSDRAMELFRFRWVEDQALDMAVPEEVSRRFDGMWPDLPRGFTTSTCLVVTPEVVESVLNSPLPSSANQSERSRLPFVVAVSRAAHIPSPEEGGEDVFGADFKGHFNVALESLLGTFYGITALDIIDLPKLTVGMRNERDVWCHPHRGGVRHYQEGLEGEALH